MDQTNQHHPSQLDRFIAFEGGKAKNFDLKKKKRKQESEEASFRKPKLPFRGPSRFQSEEEKGKAPLELQSGYGHEEDLIEFGSHGNILEYKQKHGFVLSSGRWKVNEPEAETAKTKKSTIDKEFEQYFSEFFPSFDS